MFDNVDYDTNDTNPLWIRWHGFLFHLYENEDKIVTVDICTDEEEPFPLTGVWVEDLGLFTKETK